MVYGVVRMVGGGITKERTRMTSRAARYEATTKACAVLVLAALACDESSGAVTSLQPRASRFMRYGAASGADLQPTSGCGDSLRASGVGTAGPTADAELYVFRGAEVDMWRSGQKRHEGR